MPVNMRRHAMGLVGQPIIAHHVDGTIYRGILHRVTDDGIYIRTMRGAMYASTDKKDANVQHADKGMSHPKDASPVFWWPFFFIPFFLLAALWWW